MGNQSNKNEAKIYKRARTKITSKLNNNNKHREYRADHIEKHTQEDIKRTLHIQRQGIAYRYASLPPEGTFEFGLLHALTWP